MIMKQKLLLLFAIVFATSISAQTFSVDGVNYYVISSTTNTVGVTSSSSYVGELVVPSMVQNAGATYTVVSILDAAFQGSTTLTSITIPNTVTEIRNNAFQFCSNLTSVDLGNSITSIGQLSFNACFSLTTVIIPSSVTNIGNNAFEFCTDLTSVTVEWATPLPITSNVFFGVNMETATLYVPIGTEGLYQAAEGWQDFGAVLPPPPATHLNFDGANDYIEIPNESNFDFTNQMTVELWMNSSVMPQQWDALVVKGDDSWRLHLNESGTVNFTASGVAPTQEINSTTSITDGNWHHIAATLGGDSIKIYVDGVLETQASASGIINNNIHTVLIGNNPIYSGRHYTGHMDDIRIWNVTRSAEQINGSKNCELQGTETGLVAYYKLNQGIDGFDNTTESTVTDATDNENHGIFHNFELTGSTSNFLAGSPVISGSTIPNAPIASAQALCDSAIVANLTPAPSSTIQWYATETGEEALTTTSALETGTYYVSEVNTNGCQSERTEISVTINPNPLPPIANSIQIYAGEATIADLTATGTDLLWYDAATGGASLDLSENLVDGSRYYVSQSSSCGESFRTAITVKEISDASQDFCGSATIADLISTPTSGATTNWFTTETGGSALTSTTELTTGTYYLEQVEAFSITTLINGFSNTSGIAVQSDGKIVVSDYSEDVIKRFNADGTGLEVLGSGFSGPVGVAIQDDGKIVVANMQEIKRMDADGSNIETLINDYLDIKAVNILTNGKIIFYDAFEGVVNVMNADGTGVETIVENGVDLQVIAIQADGKVVGIKGGFESIIRFNPDGSNLETVGGNLYFPSGVAIQADGKIVVLDAYGDINRMNSDGTGLETITNMPNSGKIAIDADGKILVNDYNDQSIKRISEAYVSNRVAVNITVNELPEAPTEEAQAFCGAATVADLTPASSATIKWYSVAAEGSELTETTALATGTYYVSAVNANGCESERTSVSITISEFPDASIVSSSITYNQNDDATALTATSGSTGLLWYTTEIGGTGNTDAPTPDTSEAGSTSYWIASTNENGCESERVEIVVTVYGPGPATHLNFDGVDDYVSLTNTYTSLTDFTIEAWIKTDKDGIIILSNSGYDSSLLAVSNGKLTYTTGRHGYGGFNLISNQNVDDNNWHHVALTTSSISTNGEASLYIDGALDASGTFGIYTVPMGSLTIGSPSTSHFSGSIDELRIWDVVRTATEIDNAKSSEVQCTEAGLIASYQFNKGMHAGENIGINTLTDVSGNGNNGTLNNFALTGSTSNWLAGSPITTLLTPPDADSLVEYVQYDTATALTATVGTNGSGLLWYTTETGGTGEIEAPTPDTSEAGSTSYWVSSINDNGCESERVEIVVTVEEVLSIVDNDQMQSIKVFPNPTNGNVSIVIPNAQASKVTVYDINGRLLINKVSTDANFSIDLNQYQSGVYILRININQNETIKQIIKI